MATDEEMEELLPTYEFELRYAVKNHDLIAASLRGLGAKLKTRLLQSDYYFSPPLPKATERGAILRIREETREDETKRVIISYKSPNILKDGVDTREEVELEVLGGVQQATRFMKKLEAQTLVKVVKERSEYALQFESVDLTITLDRVEKLGSFVEIELVSAEKEDVNRLTALGEKLAARLGLDSARKISLGYHELLMEREV